MVNYNLKKDLLHLGICMQEKEKDLCNELLFELEQIVENFKKISRCDELIGSMVQGFLSASLVTLQSHGNENDALLIELAIKKLKNSTANYETIILKLKERRSLYSCDEIWKPHNSEALYTCKTR